MIESSPQLMILEDVNKGTIVQDLSEYTVNNTQELLQLIITGNSRRFMAATGKNTYRFILQDRINFLLDHMRFCRYRLNSVRNIKIKKKN